VNTAIAGGKVNTGINLKNANVSNTAITNVQGGTVNTAIGGASLNSSIDLGN